MRNNERLRGKQLSDIFIYHTSGVVFTPRFLVFRKKVESVSVKFQPLNSYFMLGRN